MSSLLRKILSSFILVTVLLVSLVGICKQMLNATCLGCAQHEVAMVETASHHDMAECGMDAKSCPAPVGDHMTTFASLYPATPVNAADLASILFVVFAVAFLFDTKKHFVDFERMRAKTRSYIRKRLGASKLDVLVVAFSRGILHSKIYA
jgi:hypothetical protein